MRFCQQLLGREHLHLHEYVQHLGHMLAAEPVQYLERVRGQRPLQQRGQYVQQQPVSGG